MKKDKIMGTKKWAYWVSIGIVLILVYKFVDNFAGIGEWFGKLLSVLAPFLLGIVIAFILYGPSKAIEGLLSNKIKNKKTTRFLSITIVYAVFIWAVFMILRFILPALYASVIDLVNNVQFYYNGITTDAFEADWAPFVKDNVLKPVVDYIQAFDFTKLVTYEKVMDYVSTVIGALKALLTLFIAVICSIRVLFERETIVKYINDLAKSSMNEDGYKRFSRYFRSGNVIFLRYISSQFIDALIVAILMSIAFAILKVKYAVLLGVIIGIFNLIPYFGAIVGVLVAILITILTGGWTQAIWMGIVSIILQQIDAQIINPKITGDNLEVSPLLVVVAVVIGGEYFGIVGMLIGVPVAVLIKLMLDDFIKNRAGKKVEKVKATEIEEKNDIDIENS